MASGIDVQSQSKESSAEQQKGGAAAGPTRSQLVQRLLDASANLPQFVHDLIQTQAVTVAGTEAAAFLIERNGPSAAEDGAEPAADAAKAAAFGLRPIAHIRPDESGPEMRAAALEAFKEIVKPCIEQGKDGAFEVGAPNVQAESQFCLVTLLRNEGTVVAASAVITRARDLDRARQRLMSMQLVAGYFELFTLRRTSEQSRVVAQSHQHVLQLATSVATAEGFESAAMNLCNELATRSGAVRVSLGWVKGRNIKVKALSHTEQFDKKQELVVQLEKAMEECLDQDQVVQFDPSPNGTNSENVTRAHQALSRAQGGHAALSLPLRRREEVLGVVTLEFVPTQPLAPQVAQGLGVAVELLAPQLYDRFQNDRWLITKAGLATRDTAKKAIGPKHMLAKLIIASSVLLLLVICNLVPFVDLRWLFKVSAPFTLVPQIKQVVSAPFEGQINYIGEINGERVRPGVVVKEGDVLLRLDTQELNTKLFGVSQRVKELYGQVRKAQREEKVAEAQIYRAQLAQAESEQDLLQYQIARAEVKAPFDGVVLKGELEDKINAPVKEGDVLIEVGPLRDLKVELSVNERDVEYLIDGRDAKNQPLADDKKQHGMLATTSNPSEKYGFRIDRIVPMGEAKEGANNFKVYATLDAPSQTEWRPGMQGEARIDVAKKPLAWVWTHRLIDFVRLKLWL